MGDINRMISQRGRGGCTIAFQQPKLWNMLSTTDKFVIPPGSKLSIAQAKAVVRATSHAATARAATERKARLGTPVPSAPKEHSPSRPRRDEKGTK